MTSDEEYLINLLDTGESVLVMSTDVFEMSTQAFSFPPLAYKCKLHFAPSDQIDFKDEGLIKRLKDLNKTSGSLKFRVMSIVSSLCTLYVRILVDMFGILILNKY